MIQRYMDITQPLPDVPRLEPFRARDPVTAEHDRKIGRIEMDAYRQNQARLRPDAAA